MLKRASVAILLLSLGCAREAEPPATSFQPASGTASVEHGQATYYGNSLAGHLTASGARYQPSELTAAHKRLPFGTVVQVTREDNGKSVVVKITDRGPFGDARRIIDVSYSAAQALDMLRAGVVPVRIEVLEYGPSR